VYSKNGKNAVGMARPTVLLGSYGADEALGEVAEEVELALMRIIDAACDAERHSAV
jgi:hypothetical protein